MTDEEWAAAYEEKKARARGFEWCQRFAEALGKKGLKAFAGQQWDGYCDHRDAHNFWYFHPRNGGVSAYVQYDYDPETRASTYDAGFLDPEKIEASLERVNALEPFPPRKWVWRALGEAMEAE